jgi:cytochrome c2
MRTFALTMFCAVALLGLTAKSASAIAPFQAEFIKLYINDHPNEEFAKMVKTKAKCHICHQGKKVGPHHNAYGIHLVDLLDAKEDKKDKEKIKEALAKVAEMHSDPNDDKSPTYGELIAKGELPGGDLEKAKEEPAEEKK